MNRIKKYWPCLWIVYAIGFIYTYGHVYNAELAEQNQRYPEWAHSNKADAGFLGVCVGMLWPIYWPLKLSCNLQAPK